MQSKMLIAEITESSSKSEVGKIVGHLDLWPSWEPQPFNRHSFIDVITVHSKFQNRGIGSALIKYAIKISRKWNANKIITVTEEEAFNFYVKNGFKIFQEYHGFKAKTFKTKINKAFEVREIKTTEYSEVKDLILVSRLLSDTSAYHIWMTLQMEKYNFPYEITGEIRLPSILKRVEIKSAEKKFESVIWIYEDGTTFIIATHDPELISKSDRVIKMRDGKIIKQ